MIGGRSERKHLTKVGSSHAYLLHPIHCVCIQEICSSPVPWSHPLLFLLFPATRLTQMLWSMLVWVKLAAVANTPQKRTLESTVSYSITDGSEAGEYRWIHEYTCSWGSPSLQSFRPQVDVALLSSTFGFEIVSIQAGERHGGPPCKGHQANWKQVMSLLLPFHWPALRG